jgi:hypothetical protein
VAPSVLGLEDSPAARTCGDVREGVKTRNAESEQMFSVCPEIGHGCALHEYTPQSEALRPCVRSRSAMLMPIMPSIPAVPPNLLKISATREPPYPNSGPPQLAHQLRQSPARASTAAALWNFQNVEHSLSGDPLDSVVTSRSWVKRNC